MRNGTVCFIVEDRKVLLFLIEYGPNNRKWTGIGGFTKDGERLGDALLREIEEESYIEVEKKDLEKCAEIEYQDLMLHVFLSRKWGGKLVAKDSSIKQINWFGIAKLPYVQMFEGNRGWLPQVIAGNKIKVANGEVTVVEKFS